MKKSISIVLSLLMVFSCFTCLLTSTAQAASVSAWAELWHQGYEDSAVGDNLKVRQEVAKTGALPSAEKPGLEWGVNAAAGYFNYASADAIDATKFNYRNNTMTVTDAEAASGEKSVAIMAGMFAFSTSLGNLTPNTNYKVAVKLKGYSEIAELRYPAIYVAKTLFEGNLANNPEKQQSVCLKDSAGNYARIQNYTYKTDSFDTVELEFNSGDCETAYLVLAFNNGPTGVAGKNLWVDDLSLSTLQDVEDINAIGTFEGIKNGTSLKVKDITKFPENGEWGVSKLAGYFGATYEGTNYDKYNNAHAVTATGSSGDNAAASFKIENSGDAAHGNVLRVAHTAWVASMGIAVEKNTNYILSYDIKYAAGAKLKGGSFISTAVNTKALDEIGEEFKLAAYNLSSVNSESWTSASAAFNSGNLEKVYLIMNDRNGSNNDYYLDNITLTKVSNDSITTFGGASIRTTGNPALRFKSTIDVAAVGAATGATVSEFGFTAIRSDYLGTAALVKDGVYGSKKTVTGVAYQAGGEDNKILEQDGNKYTFRAALYNIGVNKDGSRFDYSILGKEFSVRTYVVLQHNGGTREVLYGETQSYSIFEVVKFLEDNKATYESDWNAVNSYLNAADQTADINNVANRAAAYAAWKENGSGYTGDIDQ